MQCNVQVRACMSLHYELVLWSPNIIISYLCNDISLACWAVSWNKYVPSCTRGVVVFKNVGFSNVPITSKNANFFSITLLCIGCWPVFWLYTTTPLFVPFGWVAPLPCCDKTIFTSWWWWYICDVGGWIDTLRLLWISLILRRVTGNDWSSSNNALWRRTLDAWLLTIWMPSSSFNSLLLNVSIMACNGNKTINKLLWQND